MSAGESRQGDRHGAIKSTAYRRRAEIGEDSNQSDVGPGQPRRITITGSPDASRARRNWCTRIQDGTAARAAGPRAAARSEIFVPVDPEHFGKIIGRGGDTIRRLARESGVRMQVDRANSRVQITGDAGCEVAPHASCRCSTRSGRRGDVWTDDDGDSGARSRGKNNR